MPLEVIVALIGLFATLIGAVVAYLVAKSQVDSQLTIARESAVSQVAVARENAANQVAVARESAASQVAIARENAASERALAEQKLQTENRLDIASYQAIRKLLQQTDWQMRSFGAIKHHLRGFVDNELRKLLVAAGAIAFTSEEGDELWGLLERNEGRLVPTLPASKRKGTPGVGKKGTRKPSLSASGPREGGGGGGGALSDPKLRAIRYVVKPPPTGI